MTERNIFLCGFMGSGKSTLGMRLSTLLGWPFYDLDAVIEKSQGNSIAEIFLKEGEVFFRNLEKQTLFQICDSASPDGSSKGSSRGSSKGAAPCVIALGGGILETPGVLAFLKRKGLLIYLNVPVKELEKRLRDQYAQRPLLMSALIKGNSLSQVIRDRLSARDKNYKKSDLVFHYKKNSSVEDSTSELHGLILQIVKNNRKNIPEFMDQKSLKISLDDRSYPILFGLSAIEDFFISALHLSSRKSLHSRGSLSSQTSYAHSQVPPIINAKHILIYDRKLETARAKVQQIFQNLNAKALTLNLNTHYQELAVDAGEGLKDFQNLLPLYAELMKRGVQRGDCLWALGGGTVGDAIGFLAATYMRGLDWVGLPTTLLSQVDSSVGGKTAINHPQGKNLIGVFHQPRAVICVPEFLDTLSEREKISGFGEIIKYGLIYDATFFHFLQRNWKEILNPSRNRKHLLKALHTSLRYKALAVEKDEFDRLGIREALNFGHTLGHALEAHTKYQTFQHGEAILWGMMFAIQLSFEMNFLSLKEKSEVLSFLKQVSKPSLPLNLSLDHLLPYMKKDKKNKGDSLRFVLLKKIGKSFSTSLVQMQDLRKAWEHLREEVLK